ncbi:MAG: hypothetical protein ACSHXK_04780 [Oceanococcus sp.]
MNTSARLASALVTILFIASTAHAQGAKSHPRDNDLKRGGQDSEVNNASQLMITDLRVVEDPLRTDPENGDFATWSFRYLIEQMAGEQQPSDFVRDWLQQWAFDQSINGHTVAAREAMWEKIIDPWLAASGGSQLNLDIAPFKLLAIVNRMDLRRHTADGNVATAGEGRFVFGVLDQNGVPLPPLAGTATGGFTVIFEYELPAKNMRELRSWTEAWRDLGANPLGTERYNSALEVITRRFTDRNDSLGKVNGSALNQIRTNEIALDTNWELREFVLDHASGHLRQNTVALSPDPISLNGTPMLARLINANEDALLQGDFDLKSDWFAGASLAGPFTPEHFDDWHQRSFREKDIFEGFFFDIPWSANGINSNNARHNFALNTCNGCHREETETSFLHVSFASEHTLPGAMGVAAALSEFLTGTQVTDPVDGVTAREFNDLSRRAEDFAELIASFDSRNGGQGPRKEHKPRFVH